MPRQPDGTDVPDFYADFDGSTRRLVFMYPVAPHVESGVVHYRLANTWYQQVMTKEPDVPKLAVQLPSGRIPPGRPVDFYFELVDGEAGPIRVPATGTIEMSFNDIT